MIDRIDELLDFDLKLLDALLQGHPFDDLEEADVRLVDQRGTGEPLCLVGFDEAGRGALAGPVAVACVRIDLAELDRGALTTRLMGLDDSKRLSPRRRESLAEAIRAIDDWGFGCASAAEIDRWGIVRACRLAAQRAASRLRIPPDVCLLDRGLALAEETCGPEVGEIELTGGDGRSLHIAAASVLAKVGRDAIMDRLDGRYPDYGLSRHKGYGTAAHRGAIGRLGPSFVHRRSFCTRIESAESQSC